MYNGYGSVMWLLPQPGCRGGVCKLLQHRGTTFLRLIERELIEPVGHGRVDYSLPYLRDHLRRLAAAE